MSLNRFEATLFEYIEANPDERRFWVQKVLGIDKQFQRRESAVLELNRQLWEYFEERSRYAYPFREMILHEGSQQVSMLNLSEFLMRTWVPPRKKKS